MESRTNISYLSANHICCDLRNLNMIGWRGRDADLAIHLRCLKCLWIWVCVRYYADLIVSYWCSSSWWFQLIAQLTIFVLICTYALYCQLKITLYIYIHLYRDLVSEGRKYLLRHSHKTEMSENVWVRTWRRHRGMNEGWMNLVLSAMSPKWMQYRVKRDGAVDI